MVWLRLPVDSFALLLRLRLLCLCVLRFAILQTGANESSNTFAFIASRAINDYRLAALESGNIG